MCNNGEYQTNEKCECLATYLPTHQPHKTTRASTTPTCVGGMLLSAEDDCLYCHTYIYIYIIYIILCDSHTYIHVCCCYCSIAIGCFMLTDFLVPSVCLLGCSQAHGQFYTKSRGTITGKLRQWLKCWIAELSPMAEKADEPPLLESREVALWVQATCTHKSYHDALLRAASVCY